MNRSRTADLVSFACLVFAGASVRLWLQDVPNFAPVAGIALFAGYLFRSWVLAAAVPVAIMFITDFFIGRYHPLMMCCVYGMLTFPVALRLALRHWLPLSANRLPHDAAAVSGLVGCSLLSSLMFFIVTNFAAWALFDMYETSLAGLAQCYWQAIPFFRYTVAGDVLFSFALFTGLAIVLHAQAMRVRLTSSAGVSTSS